MKKTTVLLAALIALASHNTIAKGDIFDELESETGGCVHELKLAQEEIELLQQQAKGANSLTSQLASLQAQFRALQKTSRTSIDALETENRRLSNNASASREGRRQTASLALRVASLSGELEATKSALALAQQDKSKLMQQLSSAAPASRPATTVIPTKKSTPVTLNVASSAPQYVGPIEVRARSCSQQGAIVYCSISLKSIDGFANLNMWLPHNELFTNLEEKYELSKLTIGDQSANGKSRLKHKAEEGVETIAHMKFYGVSAATTSIKSLKVYIDIGNSRSSLVFKSVPLTPTRR